MTTTSFTPFQLVHGIEEVLPIKCEIPSLNLAIELLPSTSIEEECLLFLHHLDEGGITIALANEAQKKWI